jgi:hypothetical protein
MGMFSISMSIKSKSKLFRLRICVLMPPEMKAEDQKKLENSQQLRLQGNFQEAIEIINALVQDNSADPELLAETLRLSLLTKDFKNVPALIEVLRQIPNGSDVLEAEVLLRSLLWAGVNVNQEITKPGVKFLSHWAGDALKTGQQKIFGFELTNIDVLIKSMATNFKFTGLCSDCGHRTVTWLDMTFFRHSIFACNHCLAQLSIEGSEITKFIREKKPELLSDEYYEYEKNLCRLQDRLNDYKNKDIPFLVRAQNQVFVSFLSELTFNRLSQQ